MQGFNRYIPPDYDPKKNSTLNSHQGKKHALGVRAKDIDKGILVVRFELPFNIWCESCGNHIGAGVRYNAQKKKVGNYYSTPIYAFRCKCHLCQNWFEIRTDPKNAAYEVHEGAKKKDEDWDPEANGGFATHGTLYPALTLAANAKGVAKSADTEAPSAADPPADPFAATEKTIDQQTWAKQKASRLTELYDSSDRLAADPYAVSATLRRKFRDEKKVMLEKQGRDDDLREKYGLHEEVDLGGEDVENGRARWEAGRERQGLSIGDNDNDVAEGSIAGNNGTPKMTPRNGKWRVTENGGTPSLAEVLRRSTKRKYDPFAGAADSFLASPSSFSGTPKVRGKIKDPEGIAATPARLVVKDQQAAAPVGIAGGLLAGYGSD